MILHNRKIERQRAKPSQSFQFVEELATHALDHNPHLTPITSPKEMTTNEHEQQQKSILKQREKQ